MNTWLRPAKYQIHFLICCHLTQTTLPQNFILWFGMLAGWLCSTYNDFNEEYLTQYHTPFLTTHGSGKLPWGCGLCNMCDQCRATSSLSHPITGWLELSQGWLTLANHHSAHWPWRSESCGQRAFAGGVLDFTHRIQIPQCTLGFVKQDYYTVFSVNSIIDVILSISLLSNNSSIAYPESHSMN